MSPHKTPEVVFKDGDHVRDRFKLPKPGDECVTGTIVGEPSAIGNVFVQWDLPVAGQMTTVMNVHLLKLLEEKPGE